MGYTDTYIRRRRQAEVLYGKLELSKFREKLMLAKQMNDEDYKREYSRRKREEKED